MYIHIYIYIYIYAEVGGIQINLPAPYRDHFLPLHFTLRKKDPTAQQSSDNRAIKQAAISRCAPKGRGNVPSVLLFPCRAGPSHSSLPPRAGPGGHTRGEDRDV